jgi:hypothetical protein
MSPRVAVKIASKRDTAGSPAFGALTINGGTLPGIPVVVSAWSNWSVSGGGQVTLIDGDEIFLSDEGGAELSV